MTTVAVLSCDEPTVLLGHRLRTAGLRTVGVYLRDLLTGAVEPDDFFAEHRPRLLVYDLDEPLDESLLFLCFLQDLDGLRGVPVVLTRDRATPLPPLDVPGLAAVLTRPYDMASAAMIISAAVPSRLDDAA